MEKLVQFVGTNYGQDISNELQNKIPVILSEPVHTPEVLARHAIREQMVRTGEQNLQRARLSKRAILEAAAALGADPDAPMQLAILDNEIAEGNYKQNNEVPIVQTAFPPPGNPAPKRLPSIFQSEVPCAVNGTNRSMLSKIRVDRPIARDGFRSCVHRAPAWPSQSSPQHSPGHARPSPARIRPATPCHPSSR